MRVCLGGRGVDSYLVSRLSFFFYLAGAWWRKTWLKRWALWTITGSPSLQVWGQLIPGRHDYTVVFVTFSSLWKNF